METIMYHGHDGYVFRACVRMLRLGMKTSDVRVRCDGRLMSVASYVAYARTSKGMR